MYITHTYEFRFKFKLLDSVAQHDSKLFFCFRMISFHWIGIIGHFVRDPYLTHVIIVVQKLRAHQYLKILLSHEKLIGFFPLQIAINHHLCRMSHIKVSHLMGEKLCFQCQKRPLLDWLMGKRLLSSYWHTWKWYNLHCINLLHLFSKELCLDIITLIYLILCLKSLFSLCIPGICRFNKLTKLVCSLGALVV